MSHPKTQFFAAAFSLAFVAGGAQAQSEASTLSDVSVLPIASVAGVAGASIALPAALSAGGAVFVIRGIEASAYTTVCVLERASDGVRMTVEISGRTAKKVSLVAGQTVTATTLSTGVVLMAGSEAIAFVPNALGRALLHNERITL